MLGDSFWLREISFRLTNSCYPLFSNSSEEQRDLNVCSDRSRENPGISKTYSRKGHFSLTFSTGQHAEIVKAPGTSTVPVTSPDVCSPMEKWKAAFLPGKFKRKILAKHCPQRLVSAISVQVNGGNFAEETPLFSHLKWPNFFPPLKSPSCFQDRETGVI